MENDLLIKIDGLEDQIHQLLLEIEAKDKMIKDFGVNPNEARRTGVDFKKGKQYTPRGDDYE